MLPDLSEVTLESLSNIKSSFLLGKHQGQSYERDVLVIRFQGNYGIGCEGNPDATFMCAMGAAAQEAFSPEALILDLSSLDYRWGDQLEMVFGIGGNRPSAVVIGPECREAIGTLIFGENSTNDPCEQEGVFDTLDAAWAYVAKRLDEGDTPAIHQAAASGDVRQVKQLLDAGENPNRQDASGDTPLHRAKHPEIVKLLLDAGADVKATSSYSVTPLHVVENIECARLLLEAGADPDARSRGGLSPLAHVGSVEIAKLLIETGADVHLRHRSSLLHFVKKPELANLYIEKGVDVNGLDEHGQTPLDRAEEHFQTFSRQAEQFHLAGDAETAKRYAAIVAVLREHGGKLSSELR